MHSVKSSVGYTWLILCNQYFFESELGFGYWVVEKYYLNLPERLNAYLTHFDAEVDQKYFVLLRKQRKLVRNDVCNCASVQF